MKKDKKKTKRTVFTIVSIIVGLILLLLLLDCSGNMALDISSHGHGSTNKGGGESFLQSLGITDDYDYTDEEGDNYCFNDECWDNADEEYERCVAEEGYYFAPADYSSPFEIIPVAYAMTEGYDARDECEEEYWRTLTTECSQRCEEEVFMWDGSPVNNLGLFANASYPDFTSQSAISCEFWVIGGEWVSQADKVGCIDGDWIFCDSNSLTSAKTVCEQIGKVWTCSFNEAFCSEE